MPRFEDSLRLLQTWLSPRVPASCSGVTLTGPSGRSPIITRSIKGLKMQTQSLTGPELEKALKENTFVSSSVSFTGMVKTSEKPAHVQFAIAGCESWVDIPVSLIDQAEHLGKQPCKEHAHPWVRVSLKESKDPLAQLLNALFSQLSQTTTLQPSSSEDADSSIGQLSAKPQGGTGYLCCKRGKSFLCGFVGNKPIYCCLEWEPCTTIGTRAGGFSL